MNTKNQPTVNANLNIKFSHYISMEVVICPHCKESIIIEEINCDALIEKLIYGCGKPFQLIKNNNKLEAVICNYI